MYDLCRRLFGHHFFEIVSWYITIPVKTCMLAWMICDFKNFIPKIVNRRIYYLSDQNSLLKLEFCLIHLKSLFNHSNFASKRILSKNQEEIKEFWSVRYWITLIFKFLKKFITFLIAHSKVHAEFFFKAFSHERIALMLKVNFIRK